LSLYPTGRAVRALALWTTAGLASAAWPPLLPALLAAGVGGALLALRDARMLARMPVPLVARRIPGRLTVEREAEIALRVTNPGEAACVFDARDELPRDVSPVDPEFRAVRLGAGQSTELPCVVRPQRRGDRPLGQPLLFLRSPLGIWQQRFRGEPGAVLRVYPDTRRYLRREALDPRLIGKLGIRPSVRRGEGTEFESLREYVPGDDPRRIDQAASARRGKLVTRLHQHERNHTVVICVDTSRLMGALCGGRTKLDHAVDAALALGLAALSHGDRAELLLFDRRVHALVSPRVHRGDLGPMVECLRHAEARPVEADYAALAKSLAGQRRQRALLVVLTDFVEASTAGIEVPLRVLQRRHRTLLVTLRDPLFARIDPRAPAPTHDLYERLVLDDLLHDRELTLARLRDQAVQTLDLLPEQIVAPLLNRYLGLRYGPGR